MRGTARQAPCRPKAGPRRPPWRAACLESSQGDSRGDGTAAVYVLAGLPAGGRRRWPPRCLPGSRSRRTPRRPLPPTTAAAAAAARGLQVIAGGDKGKVGTVLDVNTKRGEVVVEGVNIKVCPPPRSRVRAPAAARPRRSAAARQRACHGAGTMHRISARPPTRAAAPAPAPPGRADQAREAGRAGRVWPDCEEGVPGAPLQCGGLLHGAADALARGLQVSTFACTPVSRPSALQRAAPAPAAAGRHPTAACTLTCPGPLVLRARRVVDGKKVRYLKKTGEVLPERIPAKPDSSE